MAKVRSPQYPIINLKEAIEKAEAVFKKDNQNRIPREVIAKDMGYNGLNGKSLGVISTVSKFGLLEGRGNETYVSDLAKKIVVYPAGSIERAEGIREAAQLPELFAELDAKFSNGQASDQAIRSYLQMNKFTASAADLATRTYLETRAFVEQECSNMPLDSEELTEEETTEAMQKRHNKPKDIDETPPSASCRKAIFALTEGDVIITFPAELSPDSVSDLSDYLEIFLKKARREAKTTEEKLESIFE